MTKRKRAMMEEYLKEKKRRSTRTARSGKRNGRPTTFAVERNTDESDDADTDDEDGDSEAEEIQRKIKQKRKSWQPRKGGRDCPEARAARWFSNPAFGENGMGESDSDARSNATMTTRRAPRTATRPTSATNEEVLEIGEMPDKQIRKERRKRGRNERREQKRRRRQAGVRHRRLEQ